MSRVLSGLSLLLSIIALAVAFVSFRATEEKAAQAVRARERLMIERLNPQLQRIYADFQLKVTQSAQNPQSVEEMIEPLILLRQPVSTQPAAGGG